MQRVLSLTASRGFVPVSVLEHKDGGLVDLDGQILAIRSDCMIDIGLFACGNAAVDFGEDAPIQHLEKHLQKDSQNFAAISRGWRNA